MKHKPPLNEITRWDILNRSRMESPERFLKKKSYYRVKDMDNLDIVKLFEDDSFVWRQRSGDYRVVISFEGPFQNLYYKVRNWTGKNRYKRITRKMLTQCISEALDTEDLQVRCECPDFQYRFAFYLSDPNVDGIYGPKQKVRPEVRNVKNNQGWVCKHLLGALYGKRFVPAAASAWYNFIQANPELSEEMIWG